VPLPCPEAEDARAIQLGSDLTLQAHSCCVDTLTLPVPPLASTMGVDVDRETWHLAGAGPVVVVSEDAQPVAMMERASATAAERRRGFRINS
jgi:hypothetical protein